MSHPALGPPIGITYHKTDAKTARVLFDDPVGNLERIRQSNERGTPGSIFNDLANPKQPKSKVGHKPALEKYVPKTQNEKEEEEEPTQ
jgi:hypothetical protein